MNELFKIKDLSLTGDKFIKKMHKSLKKRKPKKQKAYIHIDHSKFEPIFRIPMIATFDCSIEITD